VTGGASTSPRRACGERILPFDLKAATIAGALSDRAAAKGRAPGFADIAIAATAETRALVLLTRNVRNFERLCDPVIDPFETCRSKRAALAELPVSGAAEFGCQSGGHGSSFNSASIAKAAVFKAGRCSWTTFQTSVSETRWYRAEAHSRCP
jgi:hypothetical protein